MNFYLVCLLVLFLTCSGVNIYVSTTGNDLNDGKSPNQAFKTFNKALDFSKSDFTIFVAPGTYLDVEILVNNKTNITFQSMTGKETTFQKISTSDSVVEKSILQVEKSQNISFSGIIFDGDTQMSSIGSIIKIIGSSRVTISNSVLQRNRAKLGSAIFAQDNQEIILENLKIQENIASRQDAVLQQLFQENKVSVFNFNGTFMASNTPYFSTDNSFSGYGTIFAINSKIQMSNCLIRNNIAKSGGAFYLRQSMLKVSSSYFENNNVSVQGSVLFAESTSTFEFSKSSFVSNKCKDWKCKLLFSENWEKRQQSFFELLGSNRVTHDSIVLFLQIVAIIIIGLIAVDSIAIAIFLVIDEIVSRIKSKNKETEKKELDEIKSYGSTVKEVNDEKIDETKTIEEKENQNEEGNMEDVQLGEEDKEDGQLVEENENEIIEESEDVKKKSFLKQSFDDFKSRQDEQDSHYDNGILSNILGWMFSTVGVAFPKEVPKLWRFIHISLNLSLLLISTIIFLTINISFPYFTYDFIDSIETIASTIEYNLVPITPLIAYVFLIIFSSFSTGIILKKRKIWGNLLIVGGSIVVVICIIVITTLFNIFDGKTLTFQSEGISVAQGISSVFYWNIIVVGSFYSVLIIGLHQVHLYQIITQFFADMSKDIEEHKFHFVSHTAKYFKFKDLLIYQQNLANIFLTPCVVCCLFSTGVGLVFQLFGFPTRFGTIAGRYLYMVAFGGISFYFLISYAFITFIFQKSYEITISKSIEKMRDVLNNGVETKIQSKTIEELRRFENFTKKILFQFKIGAIFPLTFVFIIENATLVITLVTISNTLFPILIKTFYSQ